MPLPKRGLLVEPPAIIDRPTGRGRQVNNWKLSWHHQQGGVSGETGELALFCTTDGIEADQRARVSHSKGGGLRRMA